MSENTIPHLESTDVFTTIEAVVKLLDELTVLGSRSKHNELPKIKAAEHLDDCTALARNYKTTAEDNRFELKCLVSKLKGAELQGYGFTQSEPYTSLNRIIYKMLTRGVDLCNQVLELFGTTDIELSIAKDRCVALLTWFVSIGLESAECAKDLKTVMFVNGMSVGPKGTRVPPISVEIPKQDRTPAPMPENKEISKTSVYTDLYVTLYDASRIYGVVRTLIATCTVDELHHFYRETESDTMLKDLKTDAIQVGQLLEFVSCQLARAMPRVGDIIGVRREIVHRASNVAADWKNIYCQNERREDDASDYCDLGQDIQHLQHLCRDLVDILTPNIPDDIRTKCGAFVVYE